MNSLPVNKQTFLQKLLTTPQYRIFRHLLLVSALILISINQTFVYFNPIYLRLEIYTYLIAFFYFITYLVTGYTHIYYLVPRFLLTHRYGRFCGGFIGSVFLMAVFQALFEEIIKRRLELSFPALNLTWLFEFISNYMLVSLCFAGVVLAVLLRYWITGNQRINQLEQEHLHSEVEQLKEQISPLLLFNTLNHTGIIAGKDPSRASSMLLKLSQLLRYQLYDCNRDKVLLSSEVVFLRNYLTLQQLQTENFNYTLTYEGELNRSLVSPLLFIPFIQEMIYFMQDRNLSANLNVHFSATGKEILFFCQSIPGTEIPQETWLRVKQRLELLYPDSHALKTGKKGVELTLKQKRNYE